jgi:hypothetical protein
MPERDTVEDVWNPPRRSRRERLLDRVQVAGAIAIVLALAVVAAVVML